jgi:drug/metabolite transporter (DMT)-like permease
VTAVGLALVSALLFGGMSVGLRIGLNRHSDAALATLTTVGVALAVALAAAAVEAPSRGVHASGAWPFALAGLLQPGVGQVLVTLAVRETGSSRTSVVLGTAPLVSVAIALALLGEPATAPLLAGALLVVAGGLLLVRERRRSEHLRRVGLLLAFGACLCFAVRDNLLRWLSRGTVAPPAVAAAGSLLAAAAFLLLMLGPRVHGRVSLGVMSTFGVVGVLFGLSYVSMFEAYYRGRVTVVAPLIGTESLWGVALSVLLLRRTELVDRRLLLGAAIVVAGGALIGVYG